MNFFKKIMFLLVPLVLISGYAVSEEHKLKGDIKLKLSGFKNTAGYIGILLFKEPKGFPGKSKNAYKLWSSTFTEKDPELKIYDIEYGTYALTVLHDENENNKMDTNWIGMPREGVGVSNNAKGKFGPPKYSESAFVLNKSSITLNIEVNYMAK